MTITICILLFILGIIIGALLIPFIIYFRARRSGWDDSNVFNVFRVLCHLALHPEDFLRMRYEDGKNPFWYLTKDEFSEVVDSRPNPCSDCTNRKGCINCENGELKET